MASHKHDYSADFFKKNRDNSNSIGSGDISEQKSETDLVSVRIQNEDSEKTSNETAASAVSALFNNEDKLTAKLYSEVVDGIMDITKIEESTVMDSINDMQEKIGQRGIISEKNNFRKASYRCGYLRKYATCHTGLVKKAIWHFFQHEKSAIFNTNHLKVVSLGGGPGYDLVGFCSALQETRTDVEEINFKIIDNKGWTSVFKTILKTANGADFGSLSKLLKRVKITRHFIEADLNITDIFKDETLSSVISEADFVLMVNLKSFLSNYGNRKLVETVVDAMKVGSKFIFIDNMDKQLFDEIPRLLPIYGHHKKYKMSFKPSKFHILSISSDEAHIRVFKKK